MYVLTLQQRNVLCLYNVFFFRFWSSVVLTLSGGLILCACVFRSRVPPYLIIRQQFHDGCFSGSVARKQR